MFIEADVDKNLCSSTKELITTHRSVLLQLTSIVLRPSLSVFNNKHVSYADAMVAR